MMNRSMVLISIIITLSCTLFACASEGAKVAPKPGKWIGEGMFMTEDGEERNFKILFVVAPDRDRIEENASFWYKKRGIDQEAPYMNFWNAEPFDIEENTFLVVIFESHPLLDKILVQGTFVSTSLVEGEFETTEGIGKWTATQKDVP